METTTVYIVIATVIGNMVTDFNLTSDNSKNQMLSKKMLSLVEKNGYYVSRFKLNDFTHHYTISINSDFNISNVPNWTKHSFDKTGGKGDIHDILKHKFKQELRNLKINEIRKLYENGGRQDK